MFVADVLTATVRASGLEKAVLVGPSCVRIHARPRQVGIYLSYRLTRASKPHIGHRWGNRDQTTVNRAIQVIDQLRAEGDEAVNDLVAAILAELGLATLPPTRPVVIARPLLLSRIAAKERELAQLRADLAALDCTLLSVAPR